MHPPLSAQLQRIVTRLAVGAGHSDRVELRKRPPRLRERRRAGLRLVDIEAVAEAGAAGSDVRSAQPQFAPFTFDAEVELPDYAVVSFEREAGNALAGHCRRRQARRKRVWKRR